MFLCYNVFISEDKPQAQAEVRNTDTRTLSEPKPEGRGVSLVGAV